MRTSKFCGTLVRLACVSLSALACGTILADEPRAEALKLAKVTAPFVTPDTGLIAHLDLERLDLAKIGEEVLAEATGPAEAKKIVAFVFGGTAIQQTRLVGIGVTEAVAIVGAKLGEDGALSGSPRVVLLVHVKKGKNPKDVVEFFKTEQVGPLDEHWIAGDWIASAETDPKEIANASDLKPVKELSAIFETMLSRGNGLHVAVAPQAELKQSMAATLKRASADAPDHLPPEIKALPRLGSIVLEGESTVLSVVSDPEPRVVLASLVADAEAARDAGKIARDALAILPQAPEFRSMSVEVRALIESLQPRVEDNQVSIALESKDGSLIKAVSSGLALGAKSLRGAQSAPKAAEAVNNMKQIAIAMHNHHDAYSRFPAAAAPYPDGEGEWSWRIRLLPFIEEADLYNKLDVKKAPDADENAEILEDAETPAAYRHPAFPNDPRGTTRFAVPRLKEGGFEGEKGGQIVAIADGTSVTIMAVVLEQPVSWLDGGDWEVDLEDPTKGLLIENGMITVALFDGSVRRIKADDKELIGKMLTIAGGERIEQ